MMLLAITGAVAITALLIWVTLGNIAVYMWSDYNVWDTTKWNWKDLWPMWIVNILIAAYWWYTVGSNVTIVLG